MRHLRREFPVARFRHQEEDVGVSAAMLLQHVKNLIDVNHELRKENMRLRGFDPDTPF